LPESSSAARPIARQTVTAATADALRSKILSGEIGDGEQLRQDALAAEHGVSRIPLREALRQLEAEGLVDFHPHRGAVVSALSLAEIEELFEIRALLEPDILRRAIPRLSAEDLNRAKEILEVEAAAFRNPSGAGGWGELNWKFHSSLYAAAGRPRSLALIEKVNINLSRYMAIQLLLTHGTAQAVDEHRAILDACGARDADRAARLLRNHILGAGRSLVRRLGEERAASGGRKKAP
jgi:DNA-binding GntR family transcriptional regulator